MKICPRCGAEMNDSRSYCTRCGSKLGTASAVRNKAGRNRAALIIAICTAAILGVIAAILLLFFCGTGKANTPEPEEQSAADASAEEIEETAVSDTSAEISEEHEENEPAEKIEEDNDESLISDSADNDETSEAVIIDSDAGTAEQDTRRTVPDTDVKKNGSAEETAFYGIWCAAYNDAPSAENFLIAVKNNGFADAAVFLTTDWSNLNSKPYYVVTCGVYGSEAEAENALPDVHKVYPDAYVKYSGDYQGETSGTSDCRTMITVVSYDDIVKQDDSYRIICTDSERTDNTQVIVDSETVFDPECEMQYFSNYEEGDSVLDWYNANYEAGKNGGGSALLGVFDCLITDGHVDRIYGIYWWD